MQITTTLLETLQKELQKSSKAVHLDATIGSSSRKKFDLHKLSWVDSTLPSRFIDTLLNETTFEFPITWQLNTSSEDNPDAEKLSGLTKSLDNLINDATENIAEKGFNSFALGFPLLVKMDEKADKLIVAPILIWELTIKRVNEINTWSIEKKLGDIVAPNELLINYLINSDNVDISDLSAIISDENGLGKEELITYCQVLMNKLKLKSIQDGDITLSTKNISKIRSTVGFKLLLKKHDTNGIIFSGGLFSFFEIPKQSIIEDYETYLGFEKIELEQSDIENQAFQPFTSIPTDPTQQGILHALNYQRNLLIQGPPGTGKSRTLAAILINALENQRKTLVVCEKIIPLKVLQTTLAKDGLDEFAILITDIKKGRGEVVQKVQKKLTTFKKKKKVDVSIPYSALKHQTKKLDDLIEEINDKHRQLNKKIIQEKTWTETVGWFLSELREHKIREPLKLPDELFSFEENVLPQFNDFLVQAQKVYLAYRQYNSSDKWDANYLIGDNPFKLKAKIQADITYLHQQVKILGREIILYRKKYKQLLVKDFEEEEMMLLGTIRQVRKIIGQNLSNKDFFKEVSKIGAFFSRRKKNILFDHEILRNQFSFINNRNIDTDFFQKSYFQYNIQANLPILDGLELSIEEKRKTLTKWVGATLAELDIFNPDQKYYPDNSAKLLKTYNGVKEKLKSIKWLIPTSEIPTDERILDYIQKLAINLEEGLENEQAFYKALAWFNYLHKSTPKQRQLIEIVQPSLFWQQEFQVAYLYKLLYFHGSEKLTITEDDYQTLTLLLEQTDHPQIPYIKKLWLKKQFERTKIFNNNGDDLKAIQLYNARRKGHLKRHSLRNIIEIDADLFTTYFPIILTTPKVASSLFNGRKNFFDIVIFDEASQLWLKDTLPILLKGRQRIIAGDRHQMPPVDFFEMRLKTRHQTNINGKSPAEIVKEDSLLDCDSLLDFVEQLSFDPYYLDFHYRSAHPQLIAFSNYAFYEKRLKPLPNKRDYVPIEFIEVDGLYDASTNEIEAESILEILETKIIKDEDNKYPTVGIITINSKQKELILNKIDERRDKPAYKDFIKKIDKLRNNTAGPFFVNNLVNVQGDERDIILISTVYGNNKEGRFHHRFGPVGKVQGKNLINVLVTRAKEKIFVCSSIPPDAFLNYQNEIDRLGNNRKAIFFAYLAYAKAVSEENATAQQTILDALYKASVKENGMGSETNEQAGTFVIEVYEKLRSKYGDKHLKINQRLTEYKIDLIFDPLIKELEKIAIECDASAEHDSHEAYLYDYNREKIISANGFIFHRIWSVDWWDNPEHAARQLIEFIDAQYPDLNKQLLFANRVIDDNLAYSESGISS